MIAVCLKFTPPLGVGGRALDDRFDDRFGGVSPADRAALEVALRFGETTGNDVVAVSAGPLAAQRVLRDAMACGATSARHITAALERDSVDVAADLAAAVHGASMVVCGDYSLDRGSGSVPAFIAHHLGAAQALGLVDLDLDLPDSSGAGRGPLALRAIRRLDGGRREVLAVSTPCVVSVEGAVALDGTSVTLRRASLPGLVAAADADIDQLAPAAHRSSTTVSHVSEFRPRARILGSPTGGVTLDRVRQLLDTGGSVAHGETVELDPRASAERIIESLRHWGYLS